MKIRFKMINRRKFVEIDGVLYKHRQIKGRDFYEGEDGFLHLLMWEEPPMYVVNEFGNIRLNPWYPSPRYSYVDCYRWRREFGIKNYEDWCRKYGGVLKKKSDEKE